MITKAETNVCYLEDKTPFIFSLVYNSDAKLKCGNPCNENGDKELNIFCLGTDELKLLKDSMKSFIDEIDKYLNKQ